MKRITAYGSEKTPHINKRHGATLLHRPYDHPITKCRLREVRQAEKKDRSSKEKESRMKAERLEFQTCSNKQSQHWDMNISSYYVMLNLNSALISTPFSLRKSSNCPACEH
eukprot:1144177-Pelagomonas_calceolata.AAC.5